jgi:hypothetical protein
MEFMNRHCQCALIVGPVREVRGKCRKVCGGKGEGEFVVGGQREEGGDGVVVEEEGREEAS